MKMSDEINVVVTAERFDAECEYCPNRVETARLLTTGKIDMKVKNHFVCRRCIEQ